MSESELKRYYKEKAKKPSQYDYDEDGNLIEKNREGAVIKTIPLPTYRPPTFEEFDVMERMRMEQIAVATKNFEDARKALREALNAPDALDNDIVTLNKKVMEADAILQAIRFPLRHITVEDGIEIKALDFEKTAEKRKYPFGVAILQTRPFTLQEQYVRIGRVAPTPLVSVAEAKAAEDASVTVILFEDPDTNDFGFLSLNWVVNIDFKGARYHSAKQAIAAELAKTFNDTASLERIVAAETPDEIDYKLEDVPGDAGANEAKWTTTLKELLYDINIIKFTYPELKLRLLETKGAQLGAYIPGDNLLGIGLSLDNILAKNPINWTGQNILGKTLIDIRQKFKADIEKEKAEATAVSTAPKRRTRPKIVSAENSSTASVVAVGAPAPAPAPAPATTATPTLEVPSVEGAPIPPLMPVLTTTTTPKLRKRPVIVPS
jgi:ribA/ribD-fused uncharacterized protein